MIITFALQGENESFPAIPRADLTVASVRKFIPEAKIIQLSNNDFPALEHIDEVYRRENKGDFIEWGFGSLIDILKRGEPVLQIATDILLNGDISSVFDHDFDVAACRYPLKDRADGAFCGDVNFIKPSGLKFWQEAYDYYMGEPRIRDGWEGGQSAFLKIAQASDHKILSLPYDEYCYTPEDYDEDISKAKVIHFRGNRKGMMHYYAKPMNLLKPFSAKVVGNVADGVLEANVRAAMELPAELLAGQYKVPKDGELLIIGGGPSLEDCVGEIALRQKAGVTIWALNNTFRYLCERGIEPDAHLMLDARPENIGFVPEKTDALLLYSAQCHMSVLEKGMKAGKMIVWCPSIAEIINILNEYKKRGAIVAGGSSVGLKAIALAYLFGFKNVHLYGYDSSYRNNQNHAYKQPLNDKEAVVEITAGGREFLCSPWMVTQANEFRNSLPNFIKMGLQIFVHGDGLLPHLAQVM